MSAARPPRPPRWSFLLRDTRSPDRDAPRPLALEVRQGGKRQRVTTGRSVRPSAWDGHRQSVRSTRNQLDAPAINAFIRDTLLAMSDARRDAQRAGEPFGGDEAVRAARDLLRPREAEGTGAGTDSPSLAMFWRDYAATNPEIKSDGTRRTYETCLRQILAYDPAPKIDAITLDWYRGLVAHLRDVRGLKDSTIGRVIAKLKAVLRAADDDGLDVPRDYLKKKFKTMPSRPEKVALTLAEVTAIESVGGLTRGEERARTWWLVAARTGLRYGDLMNLRPEHFRGSVLAVTAAKTGERCRIPIHPYVRRVLPPDDPGAWPPSVTNQELNRAIKRVCRKAGLTAPHSLDGEDARPLFELVTVHTARRTFATELYRQEAKLRDIMAATGHTTEAALYRYLRLGADEKAVTLAAHPFFS